MSGPVSPATRKATLRSSPRERVGRRSSTALKTVRRATAPSATASPHISDLASQDFEIPDFFTQTGTTDFYCRAVAYTILL